MTLGKVIGVGVCEEGFSAEFFNSAYDIVNEAWLDIVGVAQFAHVQFDGDQVAFGYAVKGSCHVIEAICFLQQVATGIPRN
jgi:hypothetical protein